MKKVELLAPAGNMECLIAAVQAGADAVYLAGNKFGARAFSKNFSNEELINAINYCHLYGVKVYITVNTLIYENEVNDFINYIEFIHKNNADAIIIQDLGMFDLVRKTFPNLEIHGSTQMHIHNLDGIQLVESLGMKRVVLARETSIDTLKKIKENSNIELEVFIHGALCISYSGQCLMSSLIGGRSGNRGECAGSCRLKYDVIDEFNNKLNTNEYPLSTKDLNTLENINELIDLGITSLKIEGRMKSSEYVYTVVKLYRIAIDSYYNKGIIKIDTNELNNLKKIFNREYTKGYLFNIKNNHIINGYRPNHMGITIGVIDNYSNGYAYIKLNDTLNINSGLRVINKNKDVGINVNNFYINNKLVKIAHKGDIIKIKINDIVNKGDKVILTLDSKLNKEIKDKINKNLRRISIEGHLTAKINQPLEFTISDDINTITIKGNNINKSINQNTTKEQILSKLNKINDTIYIYNKLTLDIDNNIFIPLKELNDIRRKAFLELNNKRLYKYNFIKKDYYIDINDYNKETNLNIYTNDSNIETNKYKYIYSDKENIGNIYKYPKVIDNYKKINKDIMISELGGFNIYKNPYCDYSFNVTNSYTIAFLHSLGAKLITLSLELSDNQIKEIIDNYYYRYKKKPNLELIIEGYPEVMVSKYNINKDYNKDILYLKDRFNNKYKIINKNNLTYIYFYKKIDKYNKKYYDMGINNLRINKDI